MRSRLSNLLGLSFLILLMMACVATKQHSLKSNLIGHIAEFKYNSMPLKGKSVGKGMPLRTTLYIYDPTGMEQVDSLTGPYCKKINTKLIATVESDSLGTFKTHLNPGKYSVFVKYEGAYYIPYFSGSSWISIFEIKANELTNLDINVHSELSIQ